MVYSESEILREVGTHEQNFPQASIGHLRLVRESYQWLHSFLADWINIRIPLAHRVSHKPQNEARQ